MRLQCIPEHPRSEKRSAAGYGGDWNGAMVAAEDA